MTEWLFFNPPLARQIAHRAKNVFCGVLPRKQALQSNRAFLFVNPPLFASLNTVII
jgi:hypothetical protein